MNQNQIKLEYPQILEQLSNYCKTYIGKENALSLVPSKEKEEVKQKLEETSEALSLIERNSTPPISEIDDITIYIKILESSSSVSAKALLSLSKILQLSKELINYFEAFNKSEEFSILKEYFEKLYTNNNVTEKIQKCIIDENTIADNASEALSAIRKKIRKIEQDIKIKLTNIIS